MSRLLVFLILSLAVLVGEHFAEALPLDGFQLAGAGPRGGPYVSGNQDSCIGGGPTPGNPSQDGSVVFPKTGITLSCTIYDKFGNPYFFQGPVACPLGSCSQNGLTQMQIQSSGFGFLPEPCSTAGGSGVAPYSPGWIYFQSGGEFPPATSAPRIISPGPFLLHRTSVNYTTLPDAVGNAVNSDTIEIEPNPSSGSVLRSSTQLNGTSNITITLDSGAILGCTFSGSGIFNIFSETSFNIGGATGSPTATSQEVGYQGGVACIIIGNAGAASSGGTLHDMFINDCAFGLQWDAQPSGTATMTNLIFDHNGCTGGGSPCHNIYNGFMLPGTASKSVVNGGGSYCVTDLIGPGAMYKTRMIGGTVQNVTMAEIDPYLGHVSDTAGSFTADKCHPGWVTDEACGGQYTFGGTTANTGFVAQVGRGWASAGSFDLVRFARDGGQTLALTGSIIPGNGSNGAPVGQGVLTVTAYNVTSVPGLVPPLWSVTLGGFSFIGDGTTDGGSAGFPGSAGNIGTGTYVASQIVTTITATATSTGGSNGQFNVTAVSGPPVMQGMVFTVATVSSGNQPATIVPGGTGVGGTGTYNFTIPGGTVATATQNFPNGPYVGLYVVSVSQTVSSETIYQPVNCGYYPTGYWSDATCNAVFSESSGCVSLYQRGVFINDATYQDGPYAGAGYLFTINPSYPSNRVTYKNSAVVMNTLTPAPTGAINSNATITGLSTNVNTLGWKVGMNVCDPTQMSSNPGLGIIMGQRTFIASIASDGLSATLNYPGGTIPGASGQTDTFYAGSCLYPSSLPNGATTYPPVVDGGGNRWYPNRTAAATGESWSGADPRSGVPCCAYPWLPAPP